MKTYIVGIASLFTNENKLIKVVAEDEIRACKQALVSYNFGDSEDDSNMEQAEKDAEDQLGYYDTVEDIKIEMFNRDLLMSNPIEIQ